MMGESKREEVVRVYENLRAKLSTLAGLLCNEAFHCLSDSKQAKFSTQASSELYLSAFCIRRKSLKKEGDIQPIRNFLLRSERHPSFKTVETYAQIGLALEELADYMLDCGHKKLCGHLRGAATHLERLYRLECKAHGRNLACDDTLRLMIYNRKR